MIEIPSVIENVLQSPIRKDLVLNGDMFQLKVLRSRKFELNNFFMMQPLRPKRLGTVKNGYYAMVVGNGQLKVKGGVPFKVPGKNIIEVWQNAMGIGWMKTREELKEAIPPDYTKYIGYEFFKTHKSMINDAERTAIKTHIGKHYSLPIIQRFIEKGLKPLEAKKWTVRLIQNIIYNNTEHLAAELEILQLVADRKKEKEEQMRKRQELIS